MTERTRIVKRRKRNKLTCLSTERHVATRATTKRGCRRLGFSSRASRRALMAAGRFPAEGSAANGIHLTGVVRPRCQVGFWQGQPFGAGSVGRRVPIHHLGPASPSSSEGPFRFAQPRSHRPHPAPQCVALAPGRPSPGPTVQVNTPRFVRAFSADAMLPVIRPRMTDAPIKLWYRMTWSFLVLKPTLPAPKGCPCQNPT